MSFIFYIENENKLFSRSCVYRACRGHCVNGEGGENLSRCMLIQDKTIFEKKYLVVEKGCKCQSRLCSTGSRAGNDFFTSWN